MLRPTTDRTRTRARHRRARGAFLRLEVLALVVVAICLAVLSSSSTPAHAELELTSGPGDSLTLSNDKEGAAILSLGGMRPGDSVTDTVTLGKVEVNSRAYCGKFNFGGTEQQKKVKDLSGGERNRLHLARMLKEGANLLLLDEPTNDLDVNTLRALEEGLERFGGCAVVSSHDRWFLDRIATHILAFEGDSKVVWFEGNYSEYEADRKKRLGKEADRPHRIRYRKLTRS